MFVSTLRDVCCVLFSGPIYKLVTTDLGGERRFAAAVARRLQSLGNVPRKPAEQVNYGKLCNFTVTNQIEKLSFKLGNMKLNKTSRYNYKYEKCTGFFILI